jgi:RNA polymerase sigma-70 factor (ECF subfamily)
MAEQNAEAAMSFINTSVRSEAKSDEMIFDELFARYGRPLFRYALAIVNSAEDAEDAVQEAWVRVAREHKQLKKIHNIKAYLFSAARNSAYNTIRARRRRREVCEDAAGLDAQPSAQRADASVEYIALQKSFAGLPIEQREVLALKICDEMTFEEIARMLGASINTVAGRYRYGIERLRRALKEDYDG